jgi:hypothetical protein
MVKSTERGPIRIQLKWLDVKLRIIKYFQKIKSFNDDEEEKHEETVELENIYKEIKLMIKLKESPEIN